ncbi:MAG: Fic family protein, partial [Proteobacteria bacterium]
YWGADGQDQEAWADAQVVKEVPAILNGLYETHNAAYRGHGIRAGGTNAGATFLGSPQELAALLANPYLSVQHKPDPSGQGFLISYEYPSIHDYKRLKPLLSADVYEWIESFSPATLAHDKALESRLNQRIIEDLLRNLFRELHGKPIDAADFLQKFVSIHPFSDGNGRTSRLYLQKALVGAGQSLPPFYLSDLDLLVSKNNLTKLIESSSKAYLNLQKAMLGELIATNFGHNRAANYFHLKQFNSLTASLAPFGFGEDDVVKAQFDNDILHRRFHELFAQMKGPAWSMIADDTLPAAIELAQKYQLQPYLEFMSEKLQKQISDLKPGPGLKESNEFL